MGWVAAVVVLGLMAGLVLLDNGMMIRLTRERDRLRGLLADVVEQRNRMLWKQRGEIATANAARVRAEVRAARLEAVGRKVWDGRGYWQKMARYWERTVEVQTDRVCELTEQLASRDAAVGELKAGRDRLVRELGAVYREFGVTLTTRDAADAGSLGCLAGLYRDGGAG